VLWPLASDTWQVLGLVYMQLAFLAQSFIWKFTAVQASGLAGFSGWWNKNV